MGATTWSYFTPYQADIDKALAELRQHVFNEGQYQDGEVPLDVTAADELEQRMATVVQSLTPQQRLMWEKTQEMLAAAKQRNKKPARPPAKTIKELLKRSGEAGTHSILDVDRVAPTPTYGAVCLLPPVRLRELFGTERPTREQVQAAWGEWPEIHRRWQALYVVVYFHDEPSEIFFAGSSGD